MKKSTIKVKINSNGEITRVIGNVGQTRMNRAAANCKCTSARFSLTP